MKKSRCRMPLRRQHPHSFLASVQSTWTFCLQLRRLCSLLIPSPVVIYRFMLCGLQAVSLHFMNITYAETCFRTSSYMQLPKPSARFPDMPIIDVCIPVLRLLCSFIKVRRNDLKSHICKTQRLSRPLFGSLVTTKCPFINGNLLNSIFNSLATSPSKLIASP